MVVVLVVVASDEAVAAHLASFRGRFARRAAAAALVAAGGRRLPVRFGGIVGC